MGNFEHIGSLIESEQARTPHDRVRHSCLKELFELTGRNVIVYYSGWLQKPSVPPTAMMVTDLDVQGFMGACNGLQREKPLDLLLHTPGGQISATQAIVSYLRKMFDNIRVVVPQIAMSAGTMIACSAKSILMGKQSSLGPIDPQLRGLPAHGVIAEFQRAFEEIRDDDSENKAKIHQWQPILSQYHPTFVGECQQAIKLSEEMVTDWLSTGMFEEDSNAERVKRVVERLGSHELTKQHDRHLSSEECEEFGLKIERLEDDQKLQDAVLSVHHACMHSLSGTSALKIIENHLGNAFNVQGVAPQ